MSRFISCSMASRCRMLSSLPFSVGASIGDFFPALSSVGGDGIFDRLLGSRVLAAPDQFLVEPIQEGGGFVVVERGVLERLVLRLAPILLHDLQKFRVGGIDQFELSVVAFALAHAE